MKLEIKHISKSFSSSQFALEGINLQVHEGEIVALLGQSGSGKSTLLRLISGFELADEGEIHLNDKVLFSKSTSVPPQQRNIGMIFQEYALFPHLSIEKNISFAAKDPSSIDKWLDLIGLNSIKKNYPHELSGGMQQRVAIARALAAEPEILLLDEPFSNLDSTLKIELRSQIKTLLKKTNSTAIFVSHDTQDCFAVADKIMILHQGKCIQFGHPKEVYEKPVNEYVARLFGEINLLTEKNFQDFNLNSTNLHKINNCYLIRPDELQFIPSENGKYSIESCVFSGSHFLVQIVLKDETFWMHSKHELQRGDKGELNLK